MKTSTGLTIWWLELDVSLNCVKINCQDNNGKHRLDEIISCDKRSSVFGRSAKTII